MVLGCLRGGGGGVRARLVTSSVKSSSAAEL